METSIRSAARLAWFRTRGVDAPAPLDDTAALVADLRASGYTIDIVTQDAAHDFVWTDARSPYDLCVFELDDTPAHAYIWPYLIQYRGVLLLRCLTLHHSRASILASGARRDDFAAEFAFNEGYSPPRAAMEQISGGWPMLRVPLTASRITVLPHAGVAETLQRRYPEARVRHVPLPAPQMVPPAPRDAAPSAPVTFGMPTSGRMDVARRALARAVETGASAVLIVDDDPARLLAQSDVIVSLEWPAGGRPPMEALAAMAAARAVVAIESAASADWPALNSQTWQRRGLGDQEPVAVTIDPRDEEHSLMLAMRRLAADAGLRSRLGNAAHAWWRSHAAPGVATAAWKRVLSEAIAIARPPRPSDWPPHLDADGSARARTILAEFELTVDLLWSNAKESERMSHATG